METENLDAMEIDDLESLARIYTALANYSASCARAKRYRLSGDTLHAMLQEVVCDDIYRNLPQQYKW